MKQWVKPIPTHLFAMDVNTTSNTVTQISHRFSAEDIDTTQAPVAFESGDHTTWYIFANVEGVTRRVKVSKWDGQPMSPAALLAQCRTYCADGNVEDFWLLFDDREADRVGSWG